MTWVCVYEVSKGRNLEGDGPLVNESKMGRKWCVMYPPTIAPPMKNEKRIAWLCCAHLKYSFRRFEPFKKTDEKKEVSNGLSVRLHKRKMKSFFSLPPQAISKMKPTCPLTLGVG